MRAAEREYIPALQYMMGVWPEKVYLTIKQMAEKEETDGEVYYMLSQYYANGTIVDENGQKAIKLLENDIISGKACGKVRIINIKM